MSEVVLPDSQWTMFRYLRPFPNFERVYQGQSGSTPIAFPGELDQYAARNAVGYDPNLIAGITVPLGSRVTIWIPQTLGPNFDEHGVNLPVVNELYQYQLLWRSRTTKDFVTGQASSIGTPIQSYSSYHLPTSGFGQPQISGNPNTQRYYLPGAIRTVAFEQTEPVGTVPGVIHLRGEYLQPIGNPVWVPPLTPSGNAAVWQQGAYTGFGPNPLGPSYLTFTTDAEGDELSILASKINPDIAWNFASLDPGDLAFSNTYGTSNGQNPPNPFGILVTTGTS
jgi:hypothetical protein